MWLIKLIIFIRFRWTTLSPKPHNDCLERSSFAPGYHYLLGLFNIFLLRLCPSVCFLWLLLLASWLFGHWILSPLFITGPQRLKTKWSTCKLHAERESNPQSSCQQMSAIIWTSIPCLQPFVKVCECWPISQHCVAALSTSSAVWFPSTGQLQL